MFSAIRIPPVALFSLLLIAPLASGSGTSSALAKPKDFETQGSPRGTAALAGAQSTSSIITNTPVSADLYDQMAPEVVPDGGGGFIAVWADYRSGDIDVFAQKISAGGIAQWAGDGVPVCKQAGSQTNPRVLSDGAGGAFVVWEDARAGLTDVNIYVQRISALGVNLWGNGGVLVCGAANNQRQPVLSPNGLGGVLISWVDERGADADIYAQRVNASGVPQWTANGVAMCAATGIQQDPSVVSDGQGGALVVWRDERAGMDIYAQRVNEVGAAQWAANGIAVCGAAGNQDAPRAVADGTGGVIVTWTDSRGADEDVYTQRVSGAGVALWTPDGVATSVATGNQAHPGLCSDDAGGAIVAWEDQRGADRDVYAQRLDASGSPLWLADGVAVCAAPDQQLAPALVPDPFGGAIVAWGDARNAGSASDVYVQHLQLDGTGLWIANGVQVCDASGIQDRPAVVADGTGGAEVVWRDYRNGPYSDVYSQRVDPFGQVPDQCVPPDTLAAESPVTTIAPQNYKTFNQGWFYWSGVGVRGANGDWDLETYDQGSVGLSPYPTCFGLPLAGSYKTYGTDFVMFNFNDNHTPPGVFGVRAYRYAGSGSATIDWDTGADQMILGTPVSKIGWPGVLDVYDIPLTAGQSYTFTFTHDLAADMKVLLFSSFGAPSYYYVVPRGARVMETTGRYGFYTAPASDYYGVAIVNDSDVITSYSLTVTAGIVTDVGETPGPSTGLAGIAPNPGSGPVQIRFNMRERGKTSFQIYDMAGRQVGEIPEAQWQPGSWSVTWDGRGSGGRRLSAGIYFVQMNVNDQRVGYGRLALLH